MNSSYLRSTASATIVAAAICFPAAAQAQVRSFNVPAQAASSGIREFARQGGIQVTLASRDGQGRTTKGVTGRFDVRAGLEQLLDGTGLVIRSFDGKVAILGADAPRTVADADAEEGIVVTGSRIARPELASAMPVNVIKSEDEARFARVNIYDALIRDPAVGAGTGLYNSAGFGWDNGISAVSLRNLGANRSLTLLDGQRRVSGSARSSAVDLNMIPASMVDRIEIVTGGAAAIYGADAVTGVVNVITKRSIDGLNISATKGISQQGDASEAQISFATGGKFAEDRGSFTLGGSYIKSDPLQMADRRGLSDIPKYAINPANTGPRDGIPDNLLYHQLYGNLFQGKQATFFLKGKTYLLENSGKLREAVFDRTLALPGQWNTSGIGGDAADFSNYTQLRGGLEAMTAMARFEYAVTDDVEIGGYLDVGHSVYSGTTNVVQRDDQREGYTISIDNPFMPTVIRDMLTANGLKAIAINRVYDNFPRITQRYERNNFTVRPFIEGTLGQSLKWNAFFQYGKTSTDIDSYNVSLLKPWFAAQDVIADPVTGRPVCRNAAARAEGCVPFNVFNTTEPFSRELIDYITYTRKEKLTNSQRVFGMNLSGSVLSLPYGDVSIAAGVESRKEWMKNIDDPLAKANAIRQWGGQFPIHPELDVSMNVSEAFGEVVVPILKNLPFADRLEIEGAYRYSHYDSAGNTSTWKAGATWSPFAGISFRGVRSRSVRVANFGELYEPMIVNPSGTPGDPCLRTNINLTPTRLANCRALGVPDGGLEGYSIGPDVTSGGNPDLTPETSNSLTFGVVLQPKFLPGFDLTADYWDINITSVISQFGASTIWNLCVDLPTIDNVFCKAQTRDPTSHWLITTKTSQINAQRMQARGVDIGARYRTSLGGGQLNLSFKGSYLIEQVIETTPGIAAGNVYYDGAWNYPHFRGTLSAGYDIGKFGIAVDTRMVGAGLYNRNVQTDEVYPDNHIPARIYNDLSLQFDVNDQYRIGFGVKNILNVKAPEVSPLYSDGTQYDQVGRYVFATLNLKL